MLSLFFFSFDLPLLLFYFFTRRSIFSNSFRCFCPTKRSIRSFVYITIHVTYLTIRTRAPSHTTRTHAHREIYILRRVFYITVRRALTRVTTRTSSRVIKKRKTIASYDQGEEERVDRFDRSFVDPEKEGLRSRKRVGAQRPSTLNLSLSHSLKFRVGRKFRKISHRIKRYHVDRDIRCEFWGKNWI